MEEDRLVSYFILGFPYLCAVQQFLAVVSQDLMLFLSFKIMANRYMKLSGKNGKMGNGENLHAYIIHKKNNTEQTILLDGREIEYLMHLLIIVLCFGILITLVYQHWF